MDDGIRMIYADLDKQESTLKAQGWLIIDTSNDTIESSVIRIIHYLKLLLVERQHFMCKMKKWRDTYV